MADGGTGGTGANSNSYAAPNAWLHADTIAVEAHLGRYAVVVAVRMGRIVTHNAMLLEARIKANASGRPGPNAPTGDYRGSWTTEIRNTGTSVEGVVGTNKPQARRLEYGFYGADRLGRVFAQPAFPHVMPARQAQERQFQNDMSNLLREADG